MGRNPARPVSDALDRFFDHYYRRRPVNATFTGVHTYDAQLPDWSPAGLDLLNDEMRTLSRDLAEAFPAAAPSALRDNPQIMDSELARNFLEIQLSENA